MKEEQESSEETLRTIKMDNLYNLYNIHKIYNIYNMYNRQWKSGILTVMPLYFYSFLSLSRSVLFSFFFFSLPKADNFAKKMKAAGQNTLITQKSESMMQILL